MPLRHMLSRLSLLLAVLIGTSAAFAQDLGDMYPFEFRTDPVLQVASYYNAIALGDYARAYSYWESAPDEATLDEFTAGFADTDRVAAYLAAPVAEDAGAGNIFAQVPALLVAAHTDGTQHIFSGCVTVHKTNVPVGDATEPDPNWSLRDATFEEVEIFDLGLLNDSCDLPFDDAVSPYTNRNSPVEVLAAYYKAITSHDYARAYGYWDGGTGPSGQTLDDFTAGFSETASASVIVRGEGAFAEGAAGSMFASLPVLVTATTASGEVQHFGGCFVTRHINVPVGDATEPAPDWSLFSSDLAELGDLSDGFALLDGACAVDAVG